MGLVLIANSSNSSSVRAACAHPLAGSPGQAARRLFPFARIAASGTCMGVLSRTGSFPNYPLNAIGPQRCRWRRTTPWARRQSATGALFYQLMYPGGIPGHYLSITAGVLTYRAPSESAPPRGLSSSGHCPPSRFASSIPSLRSDPAGHLSACAFRYSITETDSCHHLGAGHIYRPPAARSPSTSGFC